MDDVARLNGRREEGEAPRFRRSLIWSLTFHLLAVSSLFMQGGSVASVPFRGVVDVRLVGAAEGERAASNGAVRPAPGERPGAPQEDLSPTGRPKKGRGRDIPHPPEEAGRNPALPEAFGGSAAEMVGGDEGGPAAPSPAAGGESFPDVPRSPQDPAPSAGMNPSMPGGEVGMAASVFASESVAAVPGGMPVISPDPGRPGGGNGSGGGTSVLRERIQSRIVYPEEAVRRGQEGDVLLRIRIGAGGVPGEIRIARSSGVRLLDAAARKGVVRAAPLPGSVGWVEVPVRFRLRQP